MLTLTCTIRTVSKTPVEETNKETGKISSVWKIVVEHMERGDRLALVNLKAKSQAQADKWAELIGKTVHIPVETVANAGKVYLWVQEGIVPTVAAQKAAA